MITEVKAYKASDGSIHETALKAFEHDQLKDLYKLFPHNICPGTILKHKTEILSIITRQL